ncbi:unnamed protein product [Periconia digitata]|uniref:Uncharacterized protein n=1 Tax=Periconia digitata TaxID=1303443 RepID=A0A9W4UJA4_9PLEO|nr:unnamed protein product [Periconia digitata]
MDVPGPPFLDDAEYPRAIRILGCELHNPDAPPLPTSISSMLFNLKIQQTYDLFLEISVLWQYYQRDPVLIPTSFPNATLALIAMRHYPESDLCGFALCPPKTIWLTMHWCALEVTFPRRLTDCSARTFIALWPAWCFLQSILNTRAAVMLESKHHEELCPIHNCHKDLYMRAIWTRPVSRFLLVDQEIYCCEMELWIRLEKRLGEEYFRWKKELGDFILRSAFQQMIRFDGSKDADIDKRA